MGVNASQATFAAQKGKNWADPTSAQFGKAGFIGQDEYNAYQSANGGTPAPSATNAAPAPTGPPPPITTQQQVGSTTATNGGQIAAGAPTTVAQSFQQALVNKLNPAPLTTSSPEVAPAIQANQLAEQRGFENNRNLLAERAAANGTNNSGGFESQLLGLAQDRAQREGQFAGNAMMQANQEKGVNDRSALASAAGLLGGNANLGQQQSLAELDATLRREGLAQQGALGSQDLALRSKLGEGQLNLGLLSALMQNDQFGKSLGQNASQFGASLDQNGLLALLGGL
jgi:hypothetical protein